MSKKYIKENIKKEQKLEEEALKELKAYATLTTKNDGYIEPDEDILTHELSQQYIKSQVSQKVREMCFSLKIDNGPVYCKYSNNGRFLLLKTEGGYFSSIDTKKMNLFFEENVKEKIYDITYLHTEDHIAVAQEKNVFIYNQYGVEVLAVRENNNVRAMQFLPYHFLLATSSSDGFLKYQDTTNGKIVSSVFIKDKRITDFKQNQSNALIYTGHRNGCVSLWTPNQKDFVAKVLCHKGSVSNIEIDRSGTYLYTTGLDLSIKVWDIRNVHKPINSLKTRFQPLETNISQKNMLAISYGNTVKIYKDLEMVNKDEYLYLQHKEFGNKIVSLNFVNHEDLLTIGHSKGVSNIIVPGSGDPIYDSYEDSPFMSRKEKQEREVKRLLDKIPFEMISIDSKAGSLVNKNVECKIKDDHIPKKEKMPRMRAMYRFYNNV